MAKTKTRVPKRIGGAKIPKKVRKQAKKALKLVDAPAVRDFAIAGLTAAAEALVQRTTTQLRAAGESQRKATLGALDLGDMLREAAIEGARRFVAGFEEAKRTPSAAKAPRPAGAAKPEPKTVNLRKPKSATSAPAKRASAKAAPAKAKPARKAPAEPRKPTARSGRSGAAPAVPE